VYTPSSSYTTSQGGLTQNVDPKHITGSFTANNKTYDGSNTATINTRSVTGVLAGDTGNVSLSGGTATFDTANVGAGKTVSMSPLFVLGGTASGNYVLDSVANTTANINAAPLTVTANSYSKTYGDVNPTMTPTVTGMVAGDGITYSDSTSATQFSNVA